jgi:hypothetical protein
MMARKKATDTEPKSSKKDAAAESGNAVKMPSTKKLNALLAESRTAYQEQRSISGELGASVKEMAEHDNLHKKAFASVKGADRMEPEALADYFAHRDHYEEVLGLRKRAGSVMRMELDEAETADPKARTSNVKPFPLPQGQAAE